MFHWNADHIENDVASQRVLLEMVGLNFLENHIRELRRGAISEFSPKRDRPLLAVNFVRNEQIIVNGKRHRYTGVAVFLFGLKNGSGTTVAVVFRRCASMVNSI